MVLGRPVLALLSPRTITLAPLESQTFRVRLREAVPPGTLLRLVSTFTPLEATPATDDSTHVTTRLTTIVRVISRVEVQQ